MNLYIGNLNYNVREGDLRGVMEEYGTVASVKLITDRETRRSKGFAFVEMPKLMAKAKRSYQAIERCRICKPYYGCKKKHFLKHKELDIPCHMMR